MSEHKELKEYEFTYNILAQSIACLPIFGHPNCWSCHHTHNLNTRLGRFCIYIDESNPDYESYSFRNKDGNVDTHLLCKKCDCMLIEQNKKLQNFYKK